MLYLIITESYGKGRSAIEIAEAAIKGGVDIVQLREKNKTREEFLGTAEKLLQICRAARVKFIVNDYPLIAKQIDADGVHLGQDDIKKFPVKEARKLLGPGKLIGVSTDSVAQVELLNNEDVDYIAYGPVFPTEVKEKCVGTADVAKVLSMSRKPVVLIGGITLSNVDILLKMGAKSIALIKDILGAEDITSQTKALKGKIG